MAEAFDGIYYSKLNDPDECLAGVNIMQFLNHIRLRYCQISQPELDSTTAKLEQSINSDLTLAVYTRKQERYQLFAEAANIPISEVTMVTAGTKHALHVGGMRQSWIEWRRTPAGNQNWNQWKVHWTEAFGDLRDINRITAGDGIQGGHANMAKTDEEMSQQMVESLDNLANAAVTKNDTVERLVLANKKPK